MSKSCAIPTNNHVYLKDKSIIELQDLIKRQESLLSKKGLIKKLPDGGANIKAEYKRIFNELESRQKMGKLTKIMSKTTISSKDVPKVLGLDSDDEMDFEEEDNNRITEEEVRKLEEPDGHQEEEDTPKFSQKLAKKCGNVTIKAKKEACLKDPDHFHSEKYPLIFEKKTYSLSVTKMIPLEESFKIIKKMASAEKELEMQRLAGRMEKLAMAATAAQSRNPLVTTHFKEDQEANWEEQGEEEEEEED